MKHISTVAALAAVLSLTACGGGDDKAKSSTTSSTASSSSTTPAAVTSISEAKADIAYNAKKYCALALGTDEVKGTDLKRIGKRIGAPFSGGQPDGETQDPPTLLCSGGYEGNTPGMSSEQAEWLVRIYAASNGEAAEGLTTANGWKSATAPNGTAVSYRGRATNDAELNKWLIEVGSRVSPT